MEAGTSSDAPEEKFELEKFLETWTYVLPESYFIKNINADLERRIIKSEMGIEDKMLTELESICDIKTLTTVEGDDVEDDDPDPAVAHCALLNEVPNRSANKLSTLKTHRRRLSAIASNPVLRKQFIPSFTEYDPNKISKAEAVKKVSDNTPYQYTDADLLIFIQLFQPMLYHRGKTSAFVDVEFIVRGSTRLCDFRDVITCLRDHVITNDLSHHPTPDERSRAGDLYKAGFLYINQVFYNDMRDLSAGDLSESILEWGKKNGYEELMGARSEVMGETRFLDLKLKLNEPYLYVHQGDCEHVFCFTDVRILHDDDPDNRANLYPFLSKTKHKKRQLCRVCYINTARWMLEDDDFAIDDPNYLCDKCLHLLHYDSRGNKIGDFKAYYFVDRDCTNT